MKLYLVRYRFILGLLLAMLVISPFQNCAQPQMSFNVEEGLSKVDDVTISGDENLQCIEFKESSNASCGDRQNGLKGSLYYLLDKGDGVSKSAYLYDKNDQAIPFNSDAINSVNVIIDRGYKIETNILISKLDVPTTEFTEGFHIGNGEYLQDIRQKKLFEGFALDLKSNLVLAAGMEPGDYEIAIASDDGTILDMDLAGNGSFQRIIDNDQQHSTRMGCSNAVLRLSHNSSIPLRVRYFQGPRTKIAVMMMMRKLNAGEAAGADSKCHGITRVSASGSDTVSTGLSGVSAGVPAERGWFIVPEDMLRH